MSEPLKVGDTSRDGKLQVVATDWDHNGTLRVTVACPFPRTQKSDEAARRLARRCLMYPEKTRSSRLIHVSPIVDDAYRILLTFAVSRLERQS